MGPRTGRCSFRGAFRGRNTPARRNRRDGTSFWPRWSRLCPRPSPGQALARLVERLRPLSPKGERGRPPIGLERMLRIHFLQQWYGLADGAMEDALYDSQALRGFAGIDLTVAGV